MVNKWLFILTIGFYLLAGCQQTIPTPSISTPAPVSSTPIPDPTQITQPTNTPGPTSTPITPTATVAPSDVLSAYLENVRIVRVDSFENDSGWNLSQAAVIAGGELKLTGLGGDEWRGVAYKQEFRAGEGFTINFKFTPGTYFGMYFENNDWNTDAYQRFGMDFRKGVVEANLFIGRDSLGFTSVPGNFYPVASTWYSFFMVAGNEGEFIALLWDPANPQKTVRYKDRIENWKDEPWIFLTQANTGTIEFDGFQLISFDSLK